MLHRATVLMLLAIPGLRGQGEVHAPAFEVASVHALDESDRRLVPGVTGPRRFVRVTTVKALVMWAYSVDSYRVLGGPDWFEQRQRFEVIADAPGPTDEAQMKLMVQTLLADRFQLKLHREIREVAAYALTVSKRGPKLPPPKGEPYDGPPLIGGYGFLTALRGGASMTDLVKVLTLEMDHPVVDETGLTEKYDIKITYDGTSTGRGGAARDTDPGQPSIFTALEQDLGLKLEAKKEPIDYLIVDSVERPSEN